MGAERKIIQRTHRKVETIESDVVVIGGGLSGAITAITCANNGLKTLLIEKYGFLGGLITTALAFPLRVFDFQKSFFELFKDEESESIRYPVFSTLIKYLLKNRAIPWHPYPDPLKISGSIIPFDFEKFKFTLLEISSDFKVNLLLHTSFVKPRLIGDMLSSVLVLGKEGLIEVRGKYFVDATGNCEVFKAVDESLVRKVKSVAKYNFIVSGCDFSKGDDRIICNSITVGDLANERYCGYVVENGKIKCAIYELPIEGHCLVFGFGDTEVEPSDVSSISLVEEKLQIESYAFIEYLRQFKPFERAKVSVLPAQIYFTESCKINALYSLSSDDIFSEKNFSDEIAVVKVSVIGEKLFPCVLAPDRKFDKLIVRLPLSSFLTKIKNLIVVGRSADVSEDLRFVLYSFPVVAKTSESIGNLISFAYRNGLNLNRLV